MVAPFRRPREYVHKILRVLHREPSEQRRVHDREDSDVDLLGVPVDLVPRSGLKERVRARAAKDLLPL